MNVYHEIEVLKKRIGELENKTGHQNMEFKRGAVFSFHGDYYLMTLVESNTYSLICIHYGNRWKDETINGPVTFNDISRYFEDDFEYIGQAKDVIEVVWPRQRS